MNFDSGIARVVQVIDAAGVAAMVLHTTASLTVRHRLGRMRRYRRGGRDEW